MAGLPFPAACMASTRACLWPAQAPLCDCLHTWYLSFPLRLLHQQRLLTVPLALPPPPAAGDVPLHFAAIHGHPMCAYNIAKACPATVLVRNNRQQTPVEVAVACERGEVSRRACRC